MAKRAIAFLMCVMLALTAVCALAASPGETVNVVLKANSDPKGAVIAKVALEYDHAVFEVVKVIDQTGKESSFKTGENITYIGTEALTNGGSLSDTVVFKIKDGAADGTYQIKGTVSEAYDINGNAVTFTVAPFEIKVGKAGGLVGDADGDGTAYTLQDIMTMIDGYCEMEPSPFILENCDTDKDGEYCTMQDIMTAIDVYCGME